VQSSDYYFTDKMNICQFSFGSMTKGIFAEQKSLCVLYEIKFIL